MKRLSVVILWVVVVWLVVGCAEPLAPSPDGAVRFTPPEEYRAWWAQMEACAGYQKDFDAVRWYTVPGNPTFISHDGHVVLGTSMPHQIWIAESLTGYKRLVQHEMLHVLLPWVGGVPDHPPAFQRCGFA